MQLQFLFRPTVATPRGGAGRDPVIENSALADTMRAVFAGLQTPTDVVGVAKLEEDAENPDLFQLYYFASIGSAAYNDGCYYTAPGIASFARGDFEAFPHSAQDCRARLEEFARRLVHGQLIPVHPR